MSEDRFKTVKKEQDAQLRKKHKNLTLSDDDMQEFLKHHLECAQKKREEFLNAYFAASIRYKIK